MIVELLDGSGAAVSGFGAAGAKVCAGVSGVSSEVLVRCCYNDAKV